jgi:hypothetical protein
MRAREVERECRMIAKRFGMTFKRQRATCNGKALYKFEDRMSGRGILSNCTLNSAYENALSGWLESRSSVTNM